MHLYTPDDGAGFGGLTWNELCVNAALTAADSTALAVMHIVYNIQLLHNLALICSCSCGIYATVNKNNVNFY